MAAKNTASSQPYAIPQTPPLNNAPAMQKWMLQQFQGLGNSLQNLNNLFPQTYSTAPSKPQVGQQAYATGTWASTLGGEGLYTYSSNGTWLSVSNPAPTIVPITASLSLTNNASGNIYANTSAQGAITVTLPPSAIGLTYIFVVTSAQSFTIQCQAKDQMGWDNAVGILGGNLQSSNVTSVLTLMCVNGGMWMTMSMTGVWNLT